MAGTAGSSLPRSDIRVLFNPGHLAWLALCRVPGGLAFRRPSLLGQPCDQAGKTFPSCMKTPTTFVGTGSCDLICDDERMRRYVHESDLDTRAV